MLLALTSVPTTSSTRYVLSAFAAARLAVPAPAGPSIAQASAGAPTTANHLIERLLLIPFILAWRPTKIK
jgi:hypothetical protein